MLYLLLHWLTGGKAYAHESPLFRATLAIMLAFLIVWALGPRVIRTLRRLKIGDRPEFDHATLNRMMADKRDTPTMGGILIVIAILVSVLLLGNLQSFYIRMGLFCLLWLALVGGIDDGLKLVSARRGSSRDGLRLWEKLIFQVALGALLAIFILRAGQTNTEVARFTIPDFPYEHAYNMFNIPFYKAPIPLPTPIFVVVAVIVLAGTSNAVNLTDGMDGLASGCMVMTAFAFMILTYMIGDPELAEYLLYRPIFGAGELAVICGAAVGACLGFLWYNAYPAQVFMGDTGSLPLGGLMGYVAIVTRMELMLLIVGGIFVVEGASVLIQIFYYKSTGGGRFFRCAPVHHHFHLGGWSETQVVMRFWLIAALFAAFALATIKLR
jgi:phospho-N-acetylmuramoyl-pentapeptide-transferase